MMNLGSVLLIVLLLFGLPFAALIWFLTWLVGIDREARRRGKDDS